MDFTRKQAVQLIHDQLRDKNYRKKNSRWHYGVVDLRELLDAIYGPPASDDEKICKQPFPPTTP